MLEAARADIVALRQQSLGESERSSAMLEAARAELAALRQQSLGESERSSAMLEAARAELAALHSRNIVNLKSIESLGQQKRDLEAELYKSKNALHESYDEATRLSNALQNQKPLQQSVDDLSRRLDDLSRRIVAARDALKPTSLKWAP